MSCIRQGVSVRKALEQAGTELNEMLAKTRGRIIKMDVNVDSGISGATVRMVVLVDESDIRPKYVLWANEAGSSEAAALHRAQERVNAQLTKLRGEVAGFYLKFITPPLPKRTYATLVLAVNGQVPEEMAKLSSTDRRERLAAALRLLGDDPRAINLARMARIFGVSRDTIYRDLQELGLRR